MRRINLFIAILLLGYALVSNAEWLTGNDLYNQLTSSNISENNKGYSYLQGVLDTEEFYLINEVLSPASFAAAMNKESKRFKVDHICFGENKVTLGQVKDIVLKYLDAHPEKRHIPASSLIRFALLENFACTNNP